MRLLFCLAILIAVVVCKTRWAIQLDPSTTPEEFAVHNRLTYLEQVAGKFYIFESTPGYSVQDFHLDNPKIVGTAEKQIARKHYIRSINDPLYPSQWHLSNIQVESAWNAGITGKGVTIAIVDDGLQTSHPDLMANVDYVNSWDYNGNKASPDPTGNDGHGTSAAGVAAAVQNNGHCGSGVAPNAKLAGIRLIAAAVYDYTEAKALSHQKGNIKIYSCSWGPYDGGTDLAGPGRITHEILKQGFNSGSIFVWAGGNGNPRNDNTNYDGYANSIYTIAIGASTILDKQAYYSEEGACLFAVTPSSGDRKGIVTTDLTGDRGYSSGSCTYSFGGTSSATPLAAGIIALLVQKHPNIDARGVQHILAKGATKIDRVNGQWSIPNKRGYSHSHKYGFGLLKVPALLAVEPPKPLKPLIVGVSERFRCRLILPTTKRFVVPRNIDFIEQVEVVVTFYSNYRGQVTISLKNKNNVESLLAKRRSDQHRGLTEWVYTTVRYWGETNKDTDEWTLIVNAPAGRGSQLRGYQVRVWGTK